MTARELLVYCVSCPLSRSALCLHSIACLFVIVLSPYHRPLTGSRQIVGYKLHPADGLGLVWAGHWRSASNNVPTAAVGRDAKGAAAERWLVASSWTDEPVLSLARPYLEQPITAAAAAAAAAAASVTVVR